MQWIRIGGEGSEIELLDSPGIIPARQVDQICALKLAICNDIGEASYDSERVAAAMVELFRRTYEIKPGYMPIEVLDKRYGIALSSSSRSGEDFILDMAAKHHHGEEAGCAARGGALYFPLVMLVHE